mmetsp:Transcript_35624/g.70836  ORF Transcript_35624/g.70836 Transcript_35624/m.70836 type:complete len:257 (+) Transcript_35624:129-899(+)
MRGGCLVLHTDTIVVVRHADEFNRLTLEISSTVDLFSQILIRERLASLCSSQALLHFIADLLLDSLELLGRVERVIHQKLLHVFNRVAGSAHTAHFLASAVSGARVRHGVAVVAVGIEFHVERALSGRAVFTHHSKPLLYSENVHAVDADTRDGATTHGVVVVVTGVSGGGSAHAVVVVLCDEDHGQVPQLRHVSSFPDLSLVSGTISIACYSNGRLLAFRGVIFGGECQTSANGSLCANNALSSVEIGALAVKVH